MTQQRSLRRKHGQKRRNNRQPEWNTHKMTIAAAAEAEAKPKKNYCDCGVWSIS